MSARGGKALDHAEAFNWARKGAEAGSARAAFRLAWHYAFGEGVAKDAREALHWYRQAAEKGQADAMNNLGGMYEGGRGVAKDQREAVRWYFKAADKDDPAAFYNLARVHDDGLGVAKDRKRAAEYMLKSLRGGYDLAHEQMTTSAAAWGKEFRLIQPSSRAFWFASCRAPAKNCGALSAKAIVADVLLYELRRPSSL